MVGVNGYRVLQAWVITFKGALLFSQCIKVHMVWPSSEHMYSDSRSWGFQAAVIVPNIILYYITKYIGDGDCNPPIQPSLTLSPVTLRMEILVDVHALQINIK